MLDASQNSVLKTIFDDYFNKVVSLYWKTHSAHWNVISADFYSLHKLLEEQYNSLWSSLDEIAEHMRSLSLAAPNRLNSVEALPFGTDRNALINDLIKDQDEVIQGLRLAIRQVDASDDISGADFLTQQLAMHEKTAWMLKASLVS